MTGTGDPRSRPAPAPGIAQAMRMRAALRLLLIACVLWCALGVAEPVTAHAGGGEVHLAAGDADPADGVPEGQTHHHHCPIAPDLPPAPAAGRVVAIDRLPVWTRVPPLASLSRAPPLQPPAAA